MDWIWKGLINPDRSIQNVPHGVVTEAHEFVSHRSWWCRDELKRILWYDSEGYLKADIEAKTLMHFGVVSENIDLSDGWKLIRIVRTEEPDHYKPKLNRLINLFNIQMETLMVQGCPKNVIDKLKIKKERVIETVICLKTTDDDHIPFVAVVPREEVSIIDLMKMTYYEDVVLMCRIHPSSLRNIVDGLPNGPYFILDVENGKGTLSAVSERAERIIKEQSRSCLTAVEGIALCAHTDVLSHHDILCINSRSSKRDRVATIAVSHYHSYPQKYPELAYCDFHWSSEVSLGSPSCHSRI